MAEAKAASRAQQRAERILLSATRLRRKIDDLSAKHPKRAIYEAKMEEYRRSIDNLSKGLPELPSAGTPGVEINVPAGLFKTKAAGAS